MGLSLSRYAGARWGSGQGASKTFERVEEIRIVNKKRKEMRRRSPASDSSGLEGADAPPERCVGMRAECWWCRVNIPEFA